MIIDLILDRKDDETYLKKDLYDTREFYNDVLAYGETGYEITRALDFGTESDVKKALCNYIYNNNYNVNICDYINSKQWLVEE